MRPILPVLAAATLLLPLAARAESGMCEYRHPAHPNWDYFASCSYTETVTDGVALWEVTVSNGSKFKTRDENGVASVNGLAALRLDRDDAMCWRTEAEDELICVYPADTLRPADRLADTGGADVLGTGGGAAGASFGGGVPGQCLLAEAGTLIEQGVCTKRENCVELEDGSGMSCLVSYDWKSGRSTETATAQGWTSLDGASAMQGDPGCLLDFDAAITFCWSKTAMTPESFPILAKLAAKEDAPASDAPAPEGESGAQAPAGAE